MESESKVQTDYLVVGQGLAGSALALELLARGKTVLVIDDGHKHASSQVAAGLINPITGRRHALCWRFLEFWNSLETYNVWSRELGGSFFHKKPILRFLRSTEEREIFEKKLEAGD
ncbi:MAG: FAD-dependent oxidoreductase, partial [Verrucomicrobiae bacterium]|nr:FAD-dependent oxidoreductase [Verrucomicrobiae bacterium]